MCAEYNVFACESALYYLLLDTKVTYAFNKYIITIITIVIVVLCNGHIV